MYTHILILTDGSELAGKAVQHGVALTKQIGAKVTMLTVLPPDMITTDREMIEIRKERMQKQLDAVAMQAAGVACETIQVEHVDPYQAIIDTADSKGCDLIVMASHWPPRHLRDRPRQRDSQGPHALQDPGVSLSMTLSRPGPAAALVRRRIGRVLFRARPQRAATCLRLFRG